MIRNSRRFLNKSSQKQQAVTAPNAKSQETLQKDFQQNVHAFRSIYLDCSDVIFRSFRIWGQMDAMIIYIEGLTDTDLLDRNVLSPLMKMEVNEDEPLGIDWIKNYLTISDTNKVNLVADCIESISTGRPILLLEGELYAVSFGLTKFEKRSVDEPEAEKVIRGPRGGFIESLQVNTSLLRRIIKSPAMKIKTMTIGEYSKTSVSLIYIEGIVSPPLIEEMESRLKRIKIDGVLDSEYIEEMIEDNPFSPFPQFLSTERPDVVSANLLEGRAAILTDGTPFAIIAPVSFFTMIQAPDDYYDHYIIRTLIRWLRFVFLFAALVFPALYVAITTFHQEMIPDALLISIATARENVPFPAFVEVLLMELMLEALREAGVRLPNQLGSAVSIVGALVIGQASVQAGLVSAPMVIVVATTGIASFMVPRYMFGYSIRMLRFPLILLASVSGLLGIMLGILAIVIHLCGLRSFGAPYLGPLAPLKKSDLKDVLWRAPLWKMDTRPRFDNEININRQAPRQKPGPERGEGTEG